MSCRRMGLHRKERKNNALTWSQNNVTDFFPLTSSVFCFFVLKNVAFYCIFSTFSHQFLTPSALQEACFCVTLPDPPLPLWKLLSCLLLFLCGGHGLVTRRDPFVSCFVMLSNPHPLQLSGTKTQLKKIYMYMYVSNVYVCGNMNWAAVKIFFLVPTLTIDNVNCNKMYILTIVHFRGKKIIVLWLTKYKTA